MSERKVLNKYYPPDFDPSKIPRMRMPRTRQYVVRLMAPFNMRCTTCGEYIYKGKKFNARKEDVEGEDYCGVRKYRFYIKCTRCLQEISFKTDPQNTDYVVEAGATRNFMALKLAEEQAHKLEKEKTDNEKNNPIALLENRTKQSKQELDMIECLEELKDLNKRQCSVDFNVLIHRVSDNVKTSYEEDEKFVKSVFGPKKVVEVCIENDSEYDAMKVSTSKAQKEKVCDTNSPTKKSRKLSLEGIVKRKHPY